MTGADRRARERAAQRAAAHRRPTPITVWLTQPPTGCCPHCADPTAAACAHRIPLDLAAQLVTAFTRPGDLVYTPDAGNAALPIAAACARRRALAHAPTAEAARRTHAAIHEHAADAAALAAVRRAEPRALPDLAARARTRAALAVLAPHHPAAPADVACLAEACARSLAPGGVLALISRQSAGGPELAGHLVTHAQATGLIYLQHIAAVEAEARGETLHPRPRPRHQPGDHGPGCACARPGHRLVHHDIHILQAP
ncbi:hypothetical protein [Phaeacidiphilus oryzae]|uniref:hypothetical protein n=1 Tax=Phaeacidiphilus oryzae TaxID=348818 RepID=UPI000562ECA7|nr:hypothetical protein [Phaeacidiphilus oryzae]